MKILRHFVDTSIIHIPESDRARPAPGLGLHVPVCEGFSFAHIGNIPRRSSRRNREAFKTHILGRGFGVGNDGNDLYNTCKSLKNELKRL